MSTTTGTGIAGAENHAQQPSTFTCHTCAKQIESPHSARSGLGLGKTLVFACSPACRDALPKIGIIQTSDGEWM